MLNNFKGSEIFGTSLLNDFIAKINQEFGLHMKIGGTEYTALVSSINTKNSSQDTEINNIKTASFEVKSSVATDANGLVLKGSYLIADTEKSYILVQSTRTVATEATPVTQIKMPTEGTGNPAWRCGTGNPIVWGAWKPLGGISEEAYIDYNSTTKSLDFNFTGV